MIMMERYELTGEVKGVMRARGEIFDLIFFGFI